MLITVSGMVGSGKSTAVKHVVDVLKAAGIECRARRFRSLRLNQLRRSSSSSNKTNTRAPRGIRWPGFQPRRLTAPVACGYLARILAFRLFDRAHRVKGCDVLDRYFYDSLVHYKLNSARERAYVAVLRWLMPVPDVAILLVASEETLASRRPEYSHEYIRQVSQGYVRLTSQLPSLLAIRTDQGPPLREQLESVIADRLHQFAASKVGRERHAS